MAIHDGISNIQKSIDVLIFQKIHDPILCNKVKQYVKSDYHIKDAVKASAASKNEDLLVTILRSDQFEPELSEEQVKKVLAGYEAWNKVVENVIVNRPKKPLSWLRVFELIEEDDETNHLCQVHVDMRQDAELFAHLKQLLKLYLRQRDKAMMLEVIEEVFYIRKKKIWTKCANTSGLTLVANHSEALPRSLPNFLRAPHPRLQIRKRLQ